MGASGVRPAAAVRTPHGQVLGWRVLEEVAGGAYFDGAEGVGVGVVSGDDQHARGLGACGDGGRGLGTVHSLAELKVHEDYVDVALGGAGDGVLTGWGFGHHFDAGFGLQHGAQPCPHYGVVVSQEQADGGAGHGRASDSVSTEGVKGSWAARAVPWPGVDSMMRVPLRAWTRVRMAASPNPPVSGSGTGRW